MRASELYLFTPISMSFAPHHESQWAAPSYVSEGAAAPTEMFRSLPNGGSTPSWGTHETTLPSSRPTSLYRRPAAPTGSGGNAYACGASTAHEHYDFENDRLVEALIGKVKSTRHAAERMGIEIAEQNSFLERFQHSMEEASNAVQRTMRRVNRFGNASGTYAHIWLLLLMIMIVFVFVYFLMRSSR